MTVTDPVAELDLETIAIQWLSDHDDVFADLDLDRTMISGRLRRALGPADRAIRIRRVSGLPVDVLPGWVQTARLQVDTFAPDELVAFALASRADVELRKLMAAALDDVVVTDARKAAGIRNDEDPDSELARYRFDLVLTAHPRAA